MNNDLTIKGGSLKLVYSDEGGSLRRASTGTIVSVGQLTMSVAHQPYVDSKTKVPGTRSVMRFQQDVLDTITGKSGISFAQVTIGRPTLAVVTDADILILIDCIRQVMATTSADANALNLAANFAVTREQ